MITYYSETRPNGKPVEPGTLCLIYEIDGQNPQAVYGKTAEEINEKLAKTLLTAQTELMRIRQTPAPGARGPQLVPAPAAPQRLTADQVVRNVADLNDPARAGEAIAALVEDSTGINFRKEAENRFVAMVTKWESEHPEFYDHPGNKRLLMSTVLTDNGLQPREMGRVTPEMMTAALVKLQGSGVLFEAPEDAQTPPAPPVPPSAFPGGSPVQPERRRIATGTRSTGFRGAPAPPQQQPKYSVAQIKSMPLERQQELIRTNDKDYSDSCEYYFGKTAATA